LTWRASGDHGDLTGDSTELFLVCFKESVDAMGRLLQPARPAKLSLVSAFEQVVSVGLEGECILFDRKNTRPPGAQET
jgi:hypothetical protein